MSTSGGEEDLVPPYLQDKHSSYHTNGSVGLGLHKHVVSATTSLTTMEEALFDLSGQKSSLQYDVSNDEQAIELSQEFANKISTTTINSDTIDEFINFDIDQL